MFDRERLMRLRNFQSRDFWAMVFARPMTILLLLFSADWKWLTPNRITLLAIVTKLAGVLLLVLDPSYAAGLWAAGLVNLGLVLDNMDGTLARYRQCGTWMGFYFDKISDAIMHQALFMAMAYRGYLVTHELWEIVIPALGWAGAIMAGYAKWVGDRVLNDLQLGHLASDAHKLQHWVLGHLKHDARVPVPERTWRDWLKWGGWALFSLLLVNEVDIFFWTAIALITERYWIFTRALCALLALGIFVGPIMFALKIRRAERRC